MTGLMSDKLRGYTWWCGDEVCDCTQPIVERRGRHIQGGLWEWSRVWEGTFRSGRLTDEERAHQENELRDACARLGAPNIDDAR